jgi:glucosyl-dolichyl phosphate glucuronosyltransferase
LPATEVSSASGVPAITVVVCTYNRYDVLPDALASLADQNLAKDVVELIVVDNSSDKPAQDVFWSEFAAAEGLRLLFEPVPGLSRARNRGVREATAPLVAFIDDDAIAAPHWCEALVTTFERHATAGIVGGPVRPIWPSAEPEWLHPWQRGFYTIVDHGPDERTLVGQEYLAGTNIAFRREALLDAGGFDEALGRTGPSLLSNEELAMTRRLQQSGLDSYYNPRAEVMHRVHADRVSRSWLRRRVAWQAVSDLLAGQTESAAGADEHWRRISKYLLTLPAEQRGFRWLFLDTDDPDRFQQQCAALQSVLHLALQYGDDPLGDGQT